MSSLFNMFGPVNAIPIEFGKRGNLPVFADAPEEVSSCNACDGVAFSRVDQLHEFDVFVRNVNNHIATAWSYSTTYPNAVQAMTAQNMIRKRAPWLSVKVLPKNRGEEIPSIVPIL